MPCSPVFRNHISNCFKVILTPLEQHILNINPTEDFLNLELWIFSHFHYLPFSEGSLPFWFPGLFSARLIYDAVHLANCLTLKQSLTVPKSVFLSLNFGTRCFQLLLYLNCKVSNPREHFCFVVVLCVFFCLVVFFFLTSNNESKESVFITYLINNRGRNPEQPHATTYYLDNYQKSHQLFREAESLMGLLSGFLI